MHHTLTIGGDGDGDGNNAIRIALFITHPLLVDRPIGTADISGIGIDGIGIQRQN